MGLNIVKGTEAFTVNTVNAVVFAQPGWGKTSLGYSGGGENGRTLMICAESPHRSDFTHLGDAIVVTDWSQVKDIAHPSNAQDLEPYTHIVVDTVNELLKVIITDIKNSPQTGLAKYGMLTQRGYGALKDQFLQWRSELNRLGKNVTLICQVTEYVGANEVKEYRPMVTGSSGAEILAASDIIGFGNYDNNGARVLRFQPNPGYYTKAPSGTPDIYVDDLNKNPHFYAGVLADFIERYNSKAKESVNAAAELQSVIDTMNDLETPEQFTEYIEHITATLPKVLQVQAKKKLLNHADFMGFVYDTEQSRFVEKEGE